MVSKAKTAAVLGMIETIAPGALTAFSPKCGERKIPNKETQEERISRANKKRARRAKNMRKAGIPVVEKGTT